MEEQGGGDRGKGGPDEKERKRARRGLKGWQKWQHADDAEIPPSDSKGARETSKGKQRGGTRQPYINYSDVICMLMGYICMSTCK